MRAYWINIDSYVDRSKFMIEQFKRYDWNNHVRISAVTPENVDEYMHPDEEYTCDPSQKFFPDCKNCKIERCALISHMLAINEGYKNGDDWFMVFEDDTVIPFDYDYEKLLKNIPQDAEVLQLFCSMPTTVQKLFETFQNHKALWVKWRMILPCASGYLISRHGAEKLLRMFKRGNTFRFKETNSCRLADVIVYENTNTYTCTIPFFYPNIDLGSIIHPEHLRSHEIGRDVIKQIINAFGENHPFVQK